MQENKKIDIYVAVPFYNEERRLPELLKSLKNAKNRLSVCLVMVNHMSTDESLNEIKKFENDFEQIIIEDEDFPIHCGGIPRSRAIRRAISEAEFNFNQTGITSPIATIDCDTQVSEEFFNDIIRFLNLGYEIVSFPERYDQDSLLRWIEIQNEENYPVSTRSLIGLNYIRYNFLWGLILSDIIETRGPGGYAMYAKTLNKLDHHQPFDEDGNPVTGENNQLGIRANRFGIKIIAAPHYTKVNPRREIKSSLGNQTKGYTPNKMGSEVFSLARESEDMPKLTSAEWSNYLISGIKRSIRMVLIRAIAFNKIDSLKDWFLENEDWRTLLRTIKRLIEKNNYPEKEFDIVGSWVYKDIMSEVEKSIGQDKMMRIVGLIDTCIPDNQSLMKWAKDNSVMLEPESLILDGLHEKFNYYYENNR